MYTYPEMSQIGLTEKQLKEQDIEYKVNEFPLTANGKALTEGFTDGFVRIISDPKYGEILGTQIVALHATDMIAEASAIMELEGTLSENLPIDCADSIKAGTEASAIRRYLSSAFPL